MAEDTQKAPEQPTDKPKRKMPKGRPFVKGDDPRRHVAVPNYTPPRVAKEIEQRNYLQLQAVNREVLGKKIFEFASKDKAELSAINKSQHTTALDQMVAALWYSNGSNKCSGTDRKIIFAAYGLATENKNLDLSSSDGSMSPTVITGVFQNLKDEEKMKILQAALTAKNQKVVVAVETEQAVASEPA